MAIENQEFLEKLKNFQREICGLATNQNAAQPPIDLRLEVILAELAFRGLDPLRDVLIHTWSVFERDYRSDLDLSNERVVIGDARSLDREKRRIKFGNSPRTEEKSSQPEWDYDDVLQQSVFLNLVTHRDGLYDYLPEGLFHQPVNKTKDRDPADRIDEIARQFDREQGARRFFQPIEQEFYHQRLLLELEERKYLLTEETLRQNNDGALFQEFWRLPPHLLTIRQLNNLLHLLPIAHRITGDMELMTDTFSLILGVPVELSLLPPIHSPIFTREGLAIPEDETIAPESDDLGRLSLGDFSLGGIYQDTMPALEIRIGPLSTDQFMAFAPGGRSQQVLNLLEGYFVAAETSVVRHLIPDSENECIHLSEASPTSVLGFNAYL